MPDKKIHLAKGYSISATEYASRGNAIIGIRRAGKTYGAMKVAEELLEAGIPFIAIDPVGVWKNLKVGISGNKGYPVIVAGGPGSDILLTPSNAVSIVLAAMKAELSLILDLFTPELSNKSTWIKIVRESIEALMQQNSNYPLRHIFIEEASEFIPQKQAPGQQMVFSTIERLARMGRNFGLGFTVINQRSQEIAKSVFELCDFTLLFKQNGKNSLKAILQWLELREIKDHQQVISTLPVLPHGECWALGDSQEAHRIKILPRKTFHPSPENNTSKTKTAKPTVSVTSFVAKLNKILQQEEDKTVVAKNVFKSIKSSPDVNVQKNNNIIHALQQDNASLQRLNSRLTTENNELRKDGNKVHNSLLKMISGMQELAKVFEEQPTEKKGVAKPLLKAPVTSEHKEKIVFSSNGDYTPAKGAKAILLFLASYPDRAFSKVQIGVGSSYSPTSSGFLRSLSELSTANLITREGGKIKITPQAQKVIGDFTPVKFSVDTFLNKLSKGEREIFQVLIDHPDRSFDKETLAAKTASGYSPTSSGFLRNLSALSTLELLVREGGQVKINPELTEL